MRQFVPSPFIISLSELSYASFVYGAKLHRWNELGAGVALKRRGSVATGKIGADKRSFHTDAFGRATCAIDTSVSVAMRPRSSNT